MSKDENESAAAPGRDVAGVVAEIDGLMAKADPAPWQVCGADRDGCVCGMIWTIPLDVVVATAHRVDDVCERTVESMNANARLIVALVNAWPALKSALAAAEQGNARLLKTLRFMSNRAMYRKHARRAVQLEAEARTEKARADLRCWSEEAERQRERAERAERALAAARGEVEGMRQAVRDMDADEADRLIHEAFKARKRLGLEDVSESGLPCWGAWIVMEELRSRVAALAAATGKQEQSLAQEQAAHNARSATYCPSCGYTLPEHSEDCGRYPKVVEELRARLAERDATLKDVEAREANLGKYEDAILRLERDCADLCGWARKLYDLGIDAGMLGEDDPECDAIVRQAHTFLRRVEAIEKRAALAPAPTPPLPAPRDEIEAANAYARLYTPATPTSDRSGA